MTTCATKIEYVREIPAVDFPIFPPPDCVQYDEATDTVSMPLWYWQKIAEYKIDVDAVREYLDLLRARAKLDAWKAQYKTDKTGGMSRLAKQTSERVDRELKSK